jgi:hypothetical protein
LGEVSRRIGGGGLGLAAAIALGALLRLGKLPGTSLNYDGLQSVTHAVRGVPVGIFSAFFHDPHPPAYYVLLGGWMTLGTGDDWVLGLSILLTLALVPSAWWVGRAWFGPRAGMVAALVCALHPLALYWSHFARMYGLLMLLALWAWHWNRRLLEDGPWRWGAAGGVALAQLGLIYSHVAGLFFAACIGLAAAAEGAHSRATTRRWLRFQAPLGLLALPAAWFAQRERPGHTRVPDLREMLDTLSIYVSGVDEPVLAWVALGASGFLVLVAALLARRESRAFAVCLLVVPFAAAALVSHVGRPIWYGSRLFAFVLPFVALGVGRLAAAGGAGVQRLQLLTAGLLLALILRGGLGYTFGYVKEQRFIDAAVLLREHAQPGDRVLVPSFRDEWALAWYLEGPDWARGVWSGGRLEALRHALDGERRPAFVHALVTYGAQPGPEVPGVIPASEVSERSLDDANRVWILVRHAAQRDALLARVDLGEQTKAFQPLGLELTLHQRP